MKHEFTAVFEREGDWYIAYCPEAGLIQVHRESRYHCRVGVCVR